MDASHYPSFREGVRLFNEAEFYEAHEVWEAIWLKESGPDKPFLQGLIQLAAAFHHVQKGKPHEARVALGRALTKLNAFPDPHHGLVLRQLAHNSQSALGAFAANPARQPPFPRMTLIGA